MRLETAPVGILTSSCNAEPFRISSALPLPMSSVRSTIKALIAALGVTLLQVVVAVGFLAPEGPLSDRYSTLIQHDSYWFMNIVERGFQTTVPPVDHKVMEVSNVAFFPAYPALAGLLRYGLNLDTDVALLVTAQVAALGFWAYFFLFCQRWNLSPALQFFGALLIVAHPAAFFLIAGYSESLFLMALLGFIYWSGADGRGAKILAALHGIVMSATRIVGIPCAAYPVVRSVFAKRWRGVRQHFPAIALMLSATLGAVFFFLYCQLRWGRWDMYMRTQIAGWGIAPDYLAVFKPSSYHWLIPALNDPTQMSQMAMSIGGLIFILVALCELLPAGRTYRPSGSDWRVRIGFYFCAAIIYCVSVSGVASVAMESMLRYQFCVHALIVLAFLHFLHEFRLPPTFLRVCGMAAVVLLGAAGLCVQVWYVWNFTRGNWVA
jgi:hypothetical protein